MDIDVHREQIVRYDPHEYDRQVYLDPRFRGGEAVVTARAIPTRIIYALWRQEGSLQRVAEYFEVDEHAVSAALDYEQRLHRVA